MRHERWGRWGRVRWVVSLDGFNRSRLGFPAMRTWDRAPDDVWREVESVPFRHRDFRERTGQVAIGAVLPAPGCEPLRFRAGFWHPDRACWVDEPAPPEALRVSGAGRGRTELQEDVT